MYFVEKVFVKLNTPLFCRRSHQVLFEQVEDMVTSLEQGVCIEKSTGMFTKNILFLCRGGNYLHNSRGGQWFSQSNILMIDRHKSWDTCHTIFASYLSNYDQHLALISYVWQSSWSISYTFRNEIRWKATRTIVVPSIILIIDHVTSDLLHAQSILK